MCCESTTFNRLLRNNHFCCDVRHFVLTDACLLVIILCANFIVHEVDNKNDDLEVLSRASFKLKHIVTLNTLFLNSFTNYVFHNTVCCQRDFYERSNDSLCSLPKYNFHLFLFLHGDLNFCAIQFYCVPLIVDSYETVACCIYTMGTEWGHLIPPWPFIFVVNNSLIFCVI